MTDMSDKPDSAIIQVLEQACDAIEHKDFRRMKKISDKMMHEAGLLQNDDFISIAVVIYALSKVIERIRKTSPEYDHLQSLLHEAHKELRAGGMGAYRKVLKKLLKLIAEVDSELKLYIDEVLVKAQVKKSSRLYEHGSSVALAAERLGIGQWELMSYIGKTQIHDAHDEPHNTKSRLDHARRLFK